MRQGVQVPTDEFRQEAAREARREIVRIMLAEFAEKRGMTVEEIKRWTAEALAADATRQTAPNEET